jgi:hypothetical protein
MPNQTNYRTDLAEINEPIAFVSRIVQSLEEGVLLEELPGSFGYDLNDNIEIHFYTAAGNVLLKSITANITDENIFKFHVVSYDDGSINTYLRIDFTELFEAKNEILLPGDYKMVINFFSDEVGSYNNKNLYIQEISPSRTEIQLGFINNISQPQIDANERELKEFVEPSFDKITAIGVAQVILKTAFDTDNTAVGLTFDTMFSENIRNRIARAQLTSNTKTNVQNFLSTIYDAVKQKITNVQDERIQEDEFFTIVQSAVDENILQIETQLPSKINIV